MNNQSTVDAFKLFSSYMKIVGIPRLQPSETTDPTLFGKKLGLINGSSWIQLWNYFFGRLYLPGVQLINVGNDGIQLNFMQAYTEGRQCPPVENIKLFANYARDLVKLTGIDLILITCSTMNRSFRYVQQEIEEFGVPVLQIDQPMMEKAVRRGGKTLVIATHGPTIRNTQLLLEETAAALGETGKLEYVGATTEEAFHYLGIGDIGKHNEIIAEIIKKHVKNGIDQVVLAQLSMILFKLSYPEPEKELGVPVLTGEEGFKRARELLRKQGNSSNE